MAFDAHFWEHPFFAPFGFANPVPLAFCVRHSMVFSLAYHLRGLWKKNRRAAD
jgi:hypothetical protein